jgi:ribonuclease HI
MAMLISLFADASFNHQHKIATWGCYCVKDGQRWTSGGIIRGTVMNSEDAEMMAIIKAVEVSLERQVIEHKDRIIIQTDCRGAILKLQDAKARFKNLRPESVERMWETREAYYSVGIPLLYQIYMHRMSITSELRWVKGHSSHHYQQPTKDGKEHPQRRRTYVNDVCDDIAKRHMNDAIKRLRSPHGQVPIMSKG